MKFTVVIEDWYRGNDDGVLLTSGGKRCCMGFAASQCGIPDEMLQGLGCVDSIPSEELKKASPLVRFDEDEDEFIDLSWVCSAYSINDNQRIDDDERMTQLQDLAIKHGHEFEFIHKPAQETASGNANQEVK